MTDEMHASRPTVAVIGLGHMGAPIARNILQGGFEVRVYNRTAAKADAFVELGATSADSPAAAARGADVVVSSLLDDGSMLDLLQREGGLLKGMDRDAVHVCNTTISPACAVELDRLHRTAGQHFVAAPVLGRPPAAEAAQLVALAAGSPAVLERVRPVLASYTTRIVEPGDDPAAAYTLKLAINFLIIAMVELFGEIFAFTGKGGIRPETVKSLLGPMFANAALGEYLDRVCEQHFEDAGFEASTGLKDVRLMLERATELDAPLPVAAIIRDRLTAALDEGLQHRDWSVIAAVARREAGLPSVAHGEGRAAPGVLHEAGR